jgi:hypothetical protein
MRTVAGRIALKHCGGCDQNLPMDTEHFFRSGKGWQALCKTCFSTRYSGRHIQRVRDLKDGKPCMDCGESFPFYVLDYDHRPDVEKKGEIAKMVSGTYTWEKILEEIAKCDLICANCHRKRTWLRATGVDGMTDKA